MVEQQDARLVHLQISRNKQAFMGLPVVQDLVSAGLALSYIEVCPQQRHYEVGKVPLQPPCGRALLILSLIGGDTT